MLEENAIKLDKVSKVYKLFDSRSHRLKETMRFFGKSLAREFWALRDISFEIPKGSTVGILGQNGSGKSTLLQLITAVLHPTSGKISVQGRIAALLELGAGFNPELTGRENVVMNGMIMGLSKEQILEQMGSIQDFADIGDFFDQPMRIYSSGMFMRVAFAAAIHVDPDILIIDEALSVGDAKFQEKCFRRFRYFQDVGKTILLVTHDRSAVPRLCNLGLLLHKGQLIEIGSPKKIVDLYSNILATGEISESKYEKQVLLAMNNGNQQTLLDINNKGENAIKNFVEALCEEDNCVNRFGYNKNEYRYGNKQAAIVDYLIFSKENSEFTTVQCGDVLNVILKIKFYQDVFEPLVGLSIRDPQGILVYGLNSGWLQKTLPAVFAGTTCCYKFEVQMNLRPGPWFLEFAVAATQSNLCDVRSNMVQLDVLAGATSFDGFVLLESNLEAIL